MADLETFTAVRYVQPLREGGSLPAVVDTDGGRFVVKFRGAGQGSKALVAELIVGMLARTLELPTPELAIIDVPAQFGRSEPDPEIQDLLRGSHGVNVGLRYLDGAFNFALQAAPELVTPAFASRVVWLDAFTTNADRTHRNPNLLLWEHRLWLIDHGAALYAHHDWDRVDARRTRSPFPLIREHLLLSLSDDIQGADAECATRLTEKVLAGILRQVPDDLLMDATSGADFPSAGAARDRYVSYLSERLREPRAFVAEAIEAREQLLADPQHRLAARR
ncbi:MAG TPA: HipA family kinase [Gemmatimonadaceae bacterium]|nr:HipA family kinase [Gemmatimonadaceae bacterium]